MITRTEYQCEICRQWCATAEHAMACERRGVFDYTRCWPRGMIFAYRNEPGDIYAGITFAVAVYGAGNGKHGAGFSVWACRDKSPYGDSLHEQTCGFYDHYELNEYHAHADHAQPSFTRMVEYLTNAGIPVTVWDGAKPVPLETWLKGRT